MVIKSGHYAFEWRWDSGDFLPDGDFYFPFGVFSRMHIESRQKWLK